jgi:hypothetical protein
MPIARTLGSFSPIIFKLDKKPILVGYQLFDFAKVNFKWWKMSNKPKLKRNSISLLKKIEVLDDLDSGRKVGEVAKQFGLANSTVVTIKNNKDEIRGSVASCSNQGLKRITRCRDLAMERTEKALSYWIDELASRNICLTTAIIQEKARQFHLNISGTEDFKASRGWFDRFQKRYSLQNVKLSGEAASADKEGATQFIPIIEEVIRKGNYSLDQVFNADETGLFWRKAPSRTFMSNDQRSVSGLKLNKDRITLLFCSNASGSLLLKPFFIGHSLNPRALKNQDKKKLPVHWNANKKAWMTSALFEQWFQNHFCKEVKKFLAEKNLSNKALLLLDNAPSHPSTLEYEGITVMFLPPNTTSLIQPMDQGIIKSFKTHYIKHALNHIIDIVDKDSNTNGITVWKSLDISNCLNFIRKSLRDMKSTTLSACWKRLLPNLATAPEFDLSRDVEEVVALSRNLSTDFSVNLEEIQTVS